MAEHELLIARLPGRTGLYLGYTRGTEWRTLARFTRGEESAAEFVEWARRAGIRYERQREEEPGGAREDG